MQKGLRYIKGNRWAALAAVATILCLFVGTAYASRTFRHNLTVRNQLTVDGATTLTGAVTQTGALTLSTSPLTLANGISLVTATGSIDLTRSTAGAVTLTCSDDNAVCAMIYDAGGAESITIGSADVTNVTVNSDVGLTFANNSDSLNNLADATFDFTRNNTGSVTLTCSDDDATCAIVYDAGGASSLTVGSADVTSVNIISDADTQLQNGATGNVDLTFHDYADSADDDMAHVLMRANCTDIATGTEDCDFSLSVVEGGAAASPRLTIDGDGNSSFGGPTNDAVLLLPDVDVQIQNQASGNVTLDYRDYADTTDDDMAHAIVTVNCTDASTGAEDCDYTVGVVEGGAAAETRFAIDADGSVSVGGAGNDAVLLLPDVDVQIQNQASGNVTLDYRDYADTTDDDMAHAIVTVNCTDASTGAEDCDYSVAVVEAGAAADTRFVLDADGGVVLGSSNSESVDLTTDGTGDAELIVPEGSIGPDDVSVMHDTLWLCGELASSGTVYSGHIEEYFDGDFTTAYVMAGAGNCDDEENATEATADHEIGLANTAFKVTGFVCEVTSAGSNGVVFTLRSAEADLTPSLTATCATGQTSCSSVGSGTTTDVAANATFAIKAVTTEDLSAQSYYCKVGIAYK